MAASTLASVYNADIEWMAVAKHFTISGHAHSSWQFESEKKKRSRIGQFPYLRYSIQLEWGTPWDRDYHTGTYSHIMTVSIILCVKVRGCERHKTAWLRRLVFIKLHGLPEYLMRLRINNIQVLSLYAIIGYRTHTMPRNQLIMNNTMPAFSRHIHSRMCYILEH